MHTLTVLILNYNQPELTIECFLHNSRHVNLNSWIVVDNGSDSRNVGVLLDFARENHWCIINYGEKGIDSWNDLSIIASGSQNYLILIPENLGYAKGNNIGLEFIQHVLHSEYVLVMNNDVFWDDDIIQPLLKGFSCGDDIFAVVPQVIEPSGEYQNPQFLPEFIKLKQVIYRLLFPFSIAIFRASGPKYRYQDQADSLSMKGNETVRMNLNKYCFIGCFFLADMVKFEEIGFFDPGTFLGTEEPRIIHKIREKGYQVIIFPGIFIRHMKGESCRRMHERKTIIEKFDRSDIDYLEKYCHFNRVQIGLIKLGSWYFRALWVPLLSKIQKGSSKSP